MDGINGFRSITKIKTFKDDVTTEQWNGYHGAYQVTVTFASNPYFPNFLLPMIVMLVR